MYRHGAVRTVTNTASYTGVTTKLILPTSISVPDGYVDWYLGIGDEVIESGISYSYEGFKVFLGVKEYGQPNSHPVPSLKMGQTVDLKLIYNYDNDKVTLFVNGSPLPWTDKSIPLAKKYLNKYNRVKMVHGVGDQGKCSYSQASFSQTQLRMDTAGATYKTWTSDLSETKRVVPGPEEGQTTLPDPRSADQFTVYNFAPLITKLEPLI